MIEIRQTETYKKWFESLKDRKSRVRIDIRIKLIALGNLGDFKPVGKGISEIRIEYGPGYRIYFLKKNNMTIILLTGGNKSTQSRDVQKAHELASSLEE
jgi:putative addiction module killer protein